MDARAPWAEALAAREGRIVAVGTDAEIAALEGPGVAVRDLGGRFVMPGLIDSHVHALWGARRDLFEVYVGYEAGLARLLGALTDRVRAAPRGDWIVGGPWRPRHLAQLGETPRALLDRIAPVHPVALADATQRSLWANSRALAAAGIDRATLSPPGGEIVRDVDGEPTWLLHEGAAGLVRAVHVETPARMAEAAAHMTGLMHSHGVTGIKEPIAFEPDLAAYRDADVRGALKLRASRCLARQAPIGPGATPLSELARWRASYATANVRTDGAKLFLDGVAPALTAAFLDPYVAQGYDASRHDPESLLQMPSADRRRGEGARRRRLHREDARDRRRRGPRRARRDHCGAGGQGSERPPPRDRPLRLRRRRRPSSFRRARRRTPIRGSAWPA